MLSTWGKFTAGAPNGSSLNLNLAFPTGGALDKRITFSRGTNATVVGSNGTIQYAPHNLLTYSEQFDNAAWGKSNATVTANAVIAPDGTTTADKLVENSGTASTHSTNRATSISITANTQHTFSCYVKAGERTRVNLLMSNSAYSNTIGATFNLSNGTVGTISYGGAASAGATSITSVGNGWYQCSISGLIDASSVNANTTIYLDNGTTTFYTGDGISGIYIWGAQLNVGSLQPYYPTTVKNLLGYTQEFDNAAWTKSNSSISTTKVTAPDGSVTGQKLVEAANTAGHFVQPATAPTFTAGQIETFSVYARASERTFIQLVMTGIGVAGGNLFAGFDLSNGTAGTPTSGVTSSITSVGNGWYLISMTVAVITGTTSVLQIRLAQNSTASASSYAGDGTSGIYIWGAQLSDSASLDPYVYNPGAAPTAAAYYGPRFDYDPVTLQPKGLLIEEQRTNLVLSSADFRSATDGNPISAWFNGNAQALNNGGTRPDGGTASRVTVVAGATNANLYQVMSCTASTTYTWSFYVRLGTLPAADFRFAVRDDTAGAFIASDIIPTQTPTTTGWTRITYTFTTPVGCVLVRPYIYRYTSASGGTFDVYGAQLEAGAFPTSYIPTTSASATRSADVAVMQGANFSSWYNQSEGTLYAEPTITGPRTSDFTVLKVTDGTNTNRMQLGTGASCTVFNSFAITAGVSQGNNIASVSPVGAIKAVFAYATNSSVTSANGTVGTTDTTVTVPSGINQMMLGRDDSAGYINGWIKRIAYYPRRLSNSELQGITS